MFASSKLHKLIQNSSWSSVEKRIETHPNEVRKAATCNALYDTLKKSKALPLHHAVAMDPPKAVVDKLLSSFDKAIRITETGYHRTALHVACMNHAHPEIIETLFHHYPDATKQCDDMKRLPIHYAIANGASMSTMQLLVHQFPESCKFADYRGWLPLHVACGVHAPLRVVNFILNLYPLAVLIHDNDGLVPLSLAKLSDPHPELISFLLKAMMEAEQQTVNRRNRSKDGNKISETSKVRWKDDNNSSEGTTAVSLLTTSNTVSISDSGVSATSKDDNNSSEGMAVNSLTTSNTLSTTDSGVSALKLV